MIGIATEYAAVHEGSLSLADLGLHASNLFFLIELMVRWCAEANTLGFFVFSSDWRVNNFDTLLVLLSVVVTSMQAFQLSTFESKAFRIVKMLTKEPPRHVEESAALVYTHI